jgi:hypothetical protein
MGYSILLATPAFVDEPGRDCTLLTDYYLLLLKPMLQQTISQTMNNYSLNYIAHHLYEINSTVITVFSQFKL